MRMALSIIQVSEVVNVLGVKELSLPVVAGSHAISFEHRILAQIHLAYLLNYQQSTLLPKAELIITRKDNDNL